jgi:hypothetical protein
MDSHEEKVFQAVRKVCWLAVLFFLDVYWLVVLQTQEEEARVQMRRKAKELQRQRQEAQKYGRKMGGMGGFGSDSTGRPPDAGMIQTTIDTTPAKPAYTPARYFKSLRVQTDHLTDCWCNNNN